MRRNGCSASRSPFTTTVRCCSMRTASRSCPGRDHHTHPYCRAGRYAVPEWNRSCLAECAFQAESAALCELRPFLHHCWKGVTELVVPVERGRTPVLIFYAGAFRGPGAPPAGFEAAHAALPPADEKSVSDLARLLTLVGQGILRALESSRESERRQPPVAQAADPEVSRRARP